MADNFIANPGVGGATFASDDIAGVQVPRVKVTWGADGVMNDASAATPMPIIDALGATEVSLAIIKNTIQTHDAAAGATPAGMLMVAVRQDTDTTPVSASGDYSYLLVNEVGRLKVAGAAAQFTAVTGNITNTAQTVAADVSQVSNVMAYCTGTFSTVNCTFEGSIDGGTSWFTVQAVRSNANTIETTTGNLSAAPAYAWELSVNALTNFRVRSTAWTSGTQVWRFTLGAYATEPIPAAQVSGTQPVSGTVTANIGTGALAAGTNAIGDVGLQYRANATGAGSVVSINCPATPAAQTIKGSAGRLIGIYLVNTNATVRWLKVFNATAPTLASTAATIRVPLPQNQPVFVEFEGGIGFATAMTCAVSATGSLTDATGAVTLDDVTGFAVFA